MADVVVHGQTFQQVKARVVQHADAVPGADPEPAVDKLHAQHVFQRRNVDLLQHGKSVVQIHMIQVVIPRLLIEPSASLGVRQDGTRPAERAVGRADEMDQFAVADRHQIARVRRAVDHAVAARAKAPHIRLGDQGIIQRGEIEIRVDHRDPASGRNVDRAVLILRDRAGVGRLHAVHLAPRPQFSALHDRHAVVIRSDPQAVAAVHIQALDAGKAVGGVHALKGIAVVADEARVAADPEESVAGLGDRVGLRRGQTVAVVVKHGGKALAASEKVDGKRSVLIAGGVEQRRGRISRRAWRRRERQQRQNDGKKDAAEPDEPVISCIRVQVYHFSHLNCPLISAARQPAPTQSCQWRV